jgi:hypothetical protein
MIKVYILCDLCRREIEAKTSNYPAEGWMLPSNWWSSEGRCNVVYYPEARLACGVCMLKLRLAPKDGES